MQQFEHNFLLVQSANIPSVGTPLFIASIGSTTSIIPTLELYAITANYDENKCQIDGAKVNIVNISKDKMDEEKILHYGIEITENYYSNFLIDNFGRDILKFLPLIKTRQIHSSLEMITIVPNYEKILKIIQGNSSSDTLQEEIMKVEKSNPMYPNEWKKLL